MRPLMPVYAIVAMDEDRCIGKDGGLPWHLPEDLKRFSQLTKGHTVLMGRKTFDSLPPKYKPLPSRLNLVLSRLVGELPFEHTKVFSSLDNVNTFLKEKNNLQGEILWIVGGSQLYQSTLEQNWCDRIYLTRVPGRYGGDAFFPSFESKFKRIESEPAQSCTFEIYERTF